MGALEDYYKHQQEAGAAAVQQTEDYQRKQALIAAQQAAAARGEDPALAGQAPPSTVATAAGDSGYTYGDAYGGYVPPGGAPALDPSVAGASGSYVGQESGGVSNTKQNFGQAFLGINPSQVSPALQATLPDAGDVAAVNAATADYQKELDARQAQLDALAKKAQAQRDAGDVLGAAKTGFDIVKFQTLPPVPKPDLVAIQHQADRNRLLNIGLGGYRPLIQQLEDQSAGQGSTAALDTYRQAADDASNRNYGIAASARGTGGQRAALMQAALGQNATDSQGAARQAGILRAQEITQARASLGAALAGQTNVFGTANLLGDTQHTQDKNQDAQNAAIASNARIAEENAKAVSNKFDKTLDTAGRALNA